MLFKVLRTLFAYLVIGLLIATWFIPLLFFINKSAYSFRVWFAIDVLICTVAHGTYRRTISGWTGQYMSLKPRYAYQAKVIDTILKLCGDGDDHCLRAYRWERMQGLIDE